MSILIRGMEMPKKGMCKTITIFDDGVVVDANGSEILGKAILDPPHGRLIDADALLSLINDSTILPDTLKWIVNPLIRGEPTVIEAEEGET